jgi:hypothetical protein
VTQCIKNGRINLPRSIDDAELVAVGVGEHHVVGILLIGPVHPLRTQADETLHVGVLVGGIEVEMMTLTGQRLRGHQLDRNPLT